MIVKLSTGGAAIGAAATGAAATGAAIGAGFKAFNCCSISEVKPSILFNSAMILSTFVISSSPAFLDLKNTFLAEALNLISSIISIHLIVKLSTGAAAIGAAATGAAATGAAIGAGSETNSFSKPNNLSPFVIFSCLSFTFFK